MCLQYQYVVTVDCHDVVKSRQPATPMNVRIAGMVKRARPGWRLRIEKADKPLPDDYLIENLVP